MKDIVTPILPEEVRGMIKKSLETAALVNYTRLSAEAKIEGKQFVVVKFIFFESLETSKKTRKNVQHTLFSLHHYRNKFTKI